MNMKKMKRLMCRAPKNLGNVHGTMGVTAGDYNSDGRMDIFIADWINQDKTLYENQESSIFAGSGGRVSGTCEKNDWTSKLEAHACRFQAGRKVKTEMPV